MKDKIVRGTAKNGMVRFIGGMTTNLVNEGTRLHNCTPVASAALGRYVNSRKPYGMSFKERKRSSYFKNRW